MNNQFVLSPLEIEVLVGLLLGDGSFQSEAADPKTYRLRILQSKKHKDYLFNLYEIFLPLITTGPFFGETKEDSRTGKRYYRWSFNTT